ncbi:hypothetical protein WDZ92_24910 [Nostoc sp. NIES-2111]
MVRVIRTSKLVPSPDRDLVPADGLSSAERLARADGLRLTHGQVRHVLWHLDCASGEDEEAFDATLKNLRRVGVPFPAVGGRGVDAVYRFGDLAELALAFVLRQQGLTQRHAVPLLIAERSTLRALMREALEEATCGRGARVEVTVTPSQNGPAGSGKGDGTGEAEPATARVRRSFPVDGVWLDFGLLVNRGGAPMSVGPKLLSPFEALHRFTARSDSLQRRPPVPVSDIALRLLDLAACAPEVKRGRPKTARPGEGG